MTHNMRGREKKGFAKELMDNYFLLPYAPFMHTPSS